MDWDLEQARAIQEPKERPQPRGAQQVVDFRKSMLCKIMQRSPDVLPPLIGGWLGGRIPHLMCRAF
jgi:hypothetical protein